METCAFLHFVVIRNLKDHNSPELGYHRAKTKSTDMKAVKFLLAVVLAAFTMGAYAQTSKEIAKERREIRKLSKAEFNEKASKDARKEAKRLKKEGWQAAPGALPMEKQLDKSYLMQQEYDEDLFPKYLMGEAMSIGETMMQQRCKHLNLQSRILQVKFRQRLRL